MTGCNGVTTLSSCSNVVCDHIAQCLTNCCTRLSASGWMDGFVFRWEGQRVGLGGYMGGCATQSLDDIEERECHRVTWLKGALKCWIADE